MDDRHPDVDDLFGLQYAKEHGGFPLTNDNFRNLQEKILEHPGLVDLNDWCDAWLSKVRISYMFVGDELSTALLSVFESIRSALWPWERFTSEHT